MRWRNVLLMLAAPLVSGCATGGGAPPKTQLQIREYQTRSFDVADTKLVMKAVLNVLQDEGFIVKETSVELGVLTASREVDIEKKGFLDRFVQKLKLSSDKDARWEKTSMIEVTANVSSHSQQTRVRANFHLKTMDNQGGVVAVRELGDEAYYQEFFSKVDKAIFIEKEKL